MEIEAASQMSPLSLSFIGMFHLMQHCEGSSCAKELPADSHYS